MALRIAGDKAAFYGCGFYGAQDTLHDDSGRHYFRGCFIQGSIDFIFGNARSLYQVDHSLIKRYAIYHSNISQNLPGLRGCKRVCFHSTKCIKKVNFDKFCETG